MFKPDDRVKVAGKIGRIAHVAAFRTRTPFLVVFPGGGEGTFSEGELRAWPDYIECDKCKGECRLSVDGVALCQSCNHRVEWRG